MPLALALPAIALFLTAAVTDWTSRRIPNLVSAALALVGLARVAADLANGAGGVAALDLGAALLVAIPAAAAFHFRLLGGGDVKLLAAGSLWLGAAALPAFLTTTALAGGVLAAGYLIALRLFPPEGREPGLPYGIAIAAGGIMTTAGLV